MKIGQNQNMFAGFKDNVQRMQLKTQNDRMSFMIKQKSMLNERIVKLKENEKMDAKTKMQKIKEIEEQLKEIDAQIQQTKIEEMEKKIEEQKKKAEEVAKEQQKYIDEKLEEKGIKQVETIKIEKAMMDYAEFGKLNALRKEMDHAASILKSEMKKDGVSSEYKMEAIAKYKAGAKKLQSAAINKLNDANKKLKEHVEEMTDEKNVRNKNQISEEEKVKEEEDKEKENKKAEN